MLGLALSTVYSLAIVISLPLHSSAGEIPRCSVEITLHRTYDSLGDASTLAPLRVVSVAKLLKYCVAASTTYIKYLTHHPSPVLLA